MPAILSRRTATPFLLLAALAVLLAATPAAAQRLRVTLTDAATGAPVAGAMVRLEDASGAVVGAGFSNGDGAIRLRARRPGPHTLRVQSQAYQAASQPVTLGPEGEAQLALRLNARPLSLDTVTVVAAATGPETGRAAFERRRMSGRGVFLDSAYVSTRRAGFAADLLYSVPGINLWARGGSRYRTPQSSMGQRCMATLVDGQPSYMGWPRFQPLAEVLFPHEVVSVEVYREFREVPPELQRYAWGRRRCGLVNYWTHWGFRNQVQTIW